MKKIFVSFLLAVMTLSMTAQTPVTIQGSVGKLKGVIHMPKVKGKKKCPFVVVMHGFTGNKNEKLLIQISEGLLKRGIGSIRFDFNAHGESDGEFRNMTIPNEIEDAKEVLATVKQLRGVDPNKIGILGHSQGGVVASMLAGELGTKAIRSVVLLAPAGNIGDGAKVGNLYTELTEGLMSYGVTRHRHGEFHYRNLTCLLKCMVICSCNLRAEHGFWFF